MSKKVLMGLVTVLVLMLSGCFLFGPSQEIIDGMAYIEGGMFTMGNVWTSSDTHQVQLSSYYIAEKEVSTAEIIEWLNDEEINGSGYIGTVQLVSPAPSTFNIQYADSNFSFVSGLYKKSENASATGVAWYGACYYCNWKSKQDGRDTVYSILGAHIVADFSKNGYRLPTEAEWEYAARDRGLRENIYTGINSIDSLDLYAWYSRNAYLISPANMNYGVHSGGEKRPNNLGLYDMSGNVAEWCWDWHASYSGIAEVDPHGPIIGAYKVCRGGSWANDHIYCAVIYRSYMVPFGVPYDLGFRLAVSAPIEN